MNYGHDSNHKKEKNLDSKSTKVKKSISTSFIRIVILTLLFTLGLMVCAGIGLTMAIIDSAPTIDYEKDFLPEGYTTFVYNQRGDEIAKLHGADANRIYAPIDTMPLHLQNAFVAIEDERFYEHGGIDMKGIFRAIISNIKNKDLTGEGASTITQQVIKNNVLNNDQNFKRKIQEQYLAIKLEQHVDKDTILESYLNTVALGRGTNGVQAATHRYFNKDVSELTLAESAVLASITQYPVRYDPISNPEHNRERQVLVLSKMLEQGLITKEAYDAAYAEDVYANIQAVSDNHTSQSKYSYFVDEVIVGVKNDLVEQHGYTSEEAYDLLYRGGLSIYITQDVHMQEIVDQAFLDESNYPPAHEDYSVKVMYSLSVNKKDIGTKHYYKEKEFDTNQQADAYVEELKKTWVEEGDEILEESKILVPQPQAAMVILDHHTGHVKAIAGGRGEKWGNQLLNRATQTARHPGSTFKILAAYLPALDTGRYTLATIQDDVPFSYAPSPNSEPWTVHNWYDSSKYKYNYKGLSTVRDGITWSMNIHAVKTLLDVGVDTSFDYLKKLGFTTLVEREVINGKIYTDKTPSLALGGVTKGVNLLELTAAYGAIANNGTYIKPIFYTKVLDHDGSILIEHTQPETRQVMKETTAFLLTDAMTDVIKKGTATIAKFKNVSMPIAGKTGTSTLKKDLVFSGYTPYYTACIWMGYDTPKGQVYNRSYHKLLWRIIMEEIHKGLPRKEFERPAGIIRASICSESGKLAVTGLCNRDPRGSTIRQEYFVKGTVPTETCDVHIKHTMCSASGLFANKYCPASDKYTKVYIKRPDPLVPSTWDPRKPPRIQDRRYELPYSMTGEYCHIHGPQVAKPDIKLPTDFYEEALEKNEDHYFIPSEDKEPDDNVIPPYLNNDYYSPPPFIYNE
ncbi:PBP1A family penicillin-binding protein [Vallitalea pronyensis]|uniref:Penicillin-binding protein 1A n=1 Tax=Vallitalea pronyensis TaxID=1348613 RepID=A0A8J8MIB6_9FIRM|nr:PBP1A family penicillin-binding protein [Vallitalea pronyensis]QUI21976.1 PBP1A family penicillin-binding protein [Vallitalea pronyensis]